jgi:CRISPR/Cas system-associated exonuclease Cas4 (RecB family)
MAYNTQGTIIHETLEDFYKKFLNKNITAEDLEVSKDKILNIFNNKISEEFENLNTKTGRGLITKKILEQYIKNYINNEIKYLERNECHVLGLEEKLSKEIVFNIDNEAISVNFGGSADRIDKNKNTVRIVDYKTGKVEPRDLSIIIRQGFDQWEYMFTDKYDKAFQLMMYAWMYWDKKPEGYNIQSGISALKNNGEYYPLELYKEYSISEENISKFEEDLKLLIEKLFDKEIPFKQRENDRICNNCEFKEVCGR